MSHYVGRQTPPRCLSIEEQQRLLHVTGEHRKGYRDHVILALALGSGLREHEIAALNVEDVWAGASIRHRIVLKVFKGSKRKGGNEEVMLPDPLRHKLERYVRNHAPTIGPLFVSKKGRRISCRQLRRMFELWQKRAGFERHYRFHDLRHTYCTAVYRSSGRDIRQVQQLARHRNLQTSVIYTHVTDEELFATLNKLPG